MMSSMETICRPRSAKPNTWLSNMASTMIGAKPRKRISTIAFGPSTDPPFSYLSLALFLVRQPKSQLPLATTPLPQRICLARARASSSTPIHLRRSGQVLMPSREYAGHQPINPVSNGTKPIHPQGVCGPTNTSARRMTPTITRIARSRPPSFVNAEIFTLSLQ